MINQVTNCVTKDLRLTIHFRFLTNMPPRQQPSPIVTAIRNCALDLINIMGIEKRKQSRYRDPAKQAEDLYDSIVEKAEAGFSESSISLIRGEIHDLHIAFTKVDVEQRFYENGRWILNTLELFNDYGLVEEDRMSLEDQETAANNWEEQNKVHRVCRLLMWIRTPTLSLQRREMFREAALNFKVVDNKSVGYDAVFSVLRSIRNPGEGQLSLSKEAVWKMAEDMAPPEFEDAPESMMEYRFATQDRAVLCGPHADADGLQWLEQAGTHAIVHLGNRTAYHGEVQATAEAMDLVYEFLPLRSGDRESVSSLANTATEFSKLLKEAVSRGERLYVSGDDFAIGKLLALWRLTNGSSLSDAVLDEGLDANTLNAVQRFDNYRTRTEH